MSRGVIAAGHEVTAAVGADVLRDGGNAVDAAVAAVMASFAAEPLLTGLGAGGYMLVADPRGAATLLDFFVEAPGRGADASSREALLPVTVSFEDAVQVFNVGPASVGTYGTPAGIAEAHRRFGTRPMPELAAPAAALARAGVRLSAAQAYVVHLLEGIVRSTPEAAAIYAPGGKLLLEGDVCRQPALAAALELLADEGPAAFYTGDAAAAVLAWLDGRGALLTGADLAAYRVIERDPVRMRYRGREVLANPPPSAGGILIAYALGLLDRGPGRTQTGGVSTAEIVAAMDSAQAERTPEFLEGLADAGFLDEFMAAKLGSTTHVSVLDAEGWACSVTCSNGEGSGIEVPGTGMHLNNMLGEQDLNPLGFHRHAPGRRLPSMMCPALVTGLDGRTEIVIGSGGSNRIRSAILQTVVGVLDRGLDIGAAVRAPRVHAEDGVVYAEPGADVAALEREGVPIARFRDINLFFGGVSAVRRDPVTGEFGGAGDPRRGGGAVVA